MMSGFTDVKCIREEEQASSNIRLFDSKPQIVKSDSLICPLLFNDFIKNQEKQEIAIDSLFFDQSIAISSSLLGSKSIKDILYSNFISKQAQLDFLLNKLESKSRRILRDFLESSVQLSDEQFVIEYKKLIQSGIFQYTSFTTAIETLNTGCNKRGFSPIDLVQRIMKEVPEDSTELILLIKAELFFLSKIHRNWQLGYKIPTSDMSLLKAVFGKAYPLISLHHNNLYKQNNPSPCVYETEFNSVMHSMGSQWKFLPVVYFDSTRSETLRITSIALDIEKNFHPIYDLDTGLNPHIDTKQMYLAFEETGLLSTDYAFLGYPVFTKRGRSATAILPSGLDRDSSIKPIIIELSQNRAPFKVLYSLCTRGFYANYQTVSKDEIITEENMSTIISRYIRPILERKYINLKVKKTDRNLWELIDLEGKQVKGLKCALFFPLQMH